MQITRLSLFLLLMLFAACGIGHAQETKSGITPDVPQSLSSLLGAGNFTNGSVNKESEAQFQLLKAVGGTRCRINLYPSVYLLNSDWERPNPACLDAILLAARRYGVRPMLLFEFYSDYEKKGTIKLGTYEQWFHLGKAFAEYCRPNGTWDRAHRNDTTAPPSSSSKVNKDRASKEEESGIRIYTAINEPDGGDFKAGGAIGPARYVAAIKGLADGVHSVDRSLLALPGGFLSPNAFRDWTLRGIGPALAPLWNDGTLDGIDLHTYYDVQYAPMEKTYERSAQHNFDAVKRACGITRDIHFYATEFNYKKRLVDEDQAAKGLLTGIWDNFGVVQNDGKTGATLFAFPWNLFNDAHKDVEFGMRLTFEPLALSARGQVLQHVMQLTQGMTFESRDPHTKGEYVLTGPGKKLWVWQDRTAWTDHPGHTYTVTNIPKTLTHLEIHAWDGLRKTLPLSGQTSLTISDLPGDETYLFLAR